MFVKKEKKMKSRFEFLLTDKDKYKQIADANGESLTTLIHNALEFYEKRNSVDSILVDIMLSLSKITSSIETASDFDDVSDAEIELMNVAYFAYGLLARTNYVSKFKRRADDQELDCHKKKLIKRFIPMHDELCDEVLSKINLL